MSITTLPEWKSTGKVILLPDSVSFTYHVTVERSVYVDSEGTDSSTDSAIYYLNEFRNVSFKKIVFTKKL